MTEGNDFFPWDDIAEGNVFESGIYLMEIAAFDDGHAASGNACPRPGSSVWNRRISRT